MPSLGPASAFSKSRRYLTSTTAAKAGALLLLIVGVYGIVQWVDFGELLRPERIADWLSQTGPFAPVVVIVLMALTVIISPLPSLPLDIAAGAFFGTVLGTTYAVIGGEIGAITSFFIARAVGRDVLTRFLHLNIAFCERCSDRHLAIFVFLSRLIPIFSFSLISYGAGLTNMSLRAFASVTLLGMIPPTFAYNYAGSRVGSGQWVFILLGLVMVALLLLIPKLALRYPNSRLVNLLRGEYPAPEVALVPPKQPIVGSAESPPQCDSCHGPME